ncbi:MAG: M23 family metallopeptidase [Bacteroidota bacterium]
MGELRPRHFHAGIDIKTEGIEGLPVYAAADGYVYRIKVSATGYGRALYLQHENGEKTLYGHLKTFEKRIEDFVLQKHYQQRKSAIDVYPTPQQFRFKKGDVIAYSGNTGSSGGPHLHFEIRREDDAVYNPLKYNFNEIRDNIPPRASRIALVTRHPESRINGAFGRLELPLYRRGNTFNHNGIIKASGTIGVEFQGIDRANMTSNSYGINKVVMEVNGTEIYRHDISLVPFETTRMIHLFANYKQWQAYNKRFQRCFKVDGNRLPFYEESNSNGYFSVPDSGFYKVKIHLYDSYNNHSQINVNLQGSSTASPVTLPIAKSENGMLQENTYVFSSNTPNAEVYVGETAYALEAAYAFNNQYYFLWDLRLGLPQSVFINQQVMNTNFVHTFMPFANTTFFHELANVKVSQYALHDTLYLQMRTEGEVYQLGDESIPLFDNVEFTLNQFNEGVDQSYQVYQLDNRNRPSFIGGIWNNGKITFKTKKFGRFKLLKDEVKPSLRVIRRDRTKLVCRIDDSLSGISDFTASINGEWLLMHYDYRRKLIWSERLDKTKPLKGNLELRVMDKAGNERIYRSLL